MRTATFSIPVPNDFHFWRTAYSHGWADLPPFSHNPEKEELMRLFSVSNNGLILAGIGSDKKGIRISAVASNAHLTPSHKKEVVAQLRDCLRLNEDFSEFHREARTHKQFKWIATSGSGRMLRSPTVFEDVVKMICTTNCSWAFTKMMVTNIVQAFGTKFSENVYSFPTPEAIAGSTERFFRKEIKSGYRSPHFIELAEKVASKKLDIESWRTSSLPTEELFTQMLTVKGVGPYAAGNIMKLVGRYDYLGLDSWVRQQFYKVHKRGRKVKDSTIEKHYAKYGRWRGLFFWLEMTRYWHDEKFRLSSLS
jgi:3-methyladenine DNA glycosylase/8-oxoguanine DNA glycosylase